MLKNLKVGTKLFAILVAPVVVLLALMYVGVTDRISISNDAARVAELTEFTELNIRVMADLQSEGILSAQFMGSSGEIDPKELQDQRARTDASVKSYNDAVAKFSPGRDYPDVAESLKRADTRFNNLSVNRKSVDGLQTSPDQSIEAFYALTGELYEVNVLISRQVDDPRLSRPFATTMALQGSAVDAGQEAMLIMAMAQRGFIPQGTEWGISKSGNAVPCPDLSNDEDCNLFPEVEAAKNARENGIKEFINIATVAQKQAQRDAFANDRFLDEEKQFFETSLDQARATPDPIPSDLTTALKPADVKDSALWLVNEAYLKTLIDPGKSLITDVKAATVDVRSEADTAARLYAVGALGAVALAFIVAFAVYRATTVPLKKLTSAAYLLSTERLPALVERLRNPEGAEGTSLAESLTPIDIHSKDEIGQLADAFNSIQHVTVEVAEEQAQLLRKGIGDIFINLARRNQTLLDRQIEFIDQLEANEEDPDQLDNLFKLDHLATRMRRNAESLLVLAGAEPPRRRGRPVALADVVRVAIGEVEDFARIQLLALDDATVGGNVAVDLAHLLSELMENATHFSPPDTMVEVVGHRADDGSYIISVSDQGIGMSADQLSEANTQLANPPLVGLALSRSLGFIVIGRLAQRFNISVKLTASPSGGVTALVTLPDDLVTYEGEPARPATPAAEAAPPAEEDASTWAPAEETADEAISLDDDVVVIEEDDEVLVPSAEDGGGLLDELVDDDADFEVPEGDEFDEGLKSLVRDELPEGPIESDTIGEPPHEPVLVEAEPEPVAEVAAVSTTSKTVAEQIAEASRAEAKAAELTAAGLVKRTPKKRSEESGGEGAPRVVTKSAGQSTRSPEEVRKMLSRYRAGMNRGKGDAGDKSDS